jgi:hypothetical protein
MTRRVSGIEKHHSVADPELRLSEASVEIRRYSSDRY